MSGFILRVVSIFFIVFIAVSFNDLKFYLSNINFFPYSFLSDINQSEDLVLTEKEWHISGISLPYKKEGKLVRVFLDDLVLAKYKKELSGSLYENMTPQEANNYIKSLEDSYKNNNSREIREWISSQKKWLIQYGSWYAKTKKDIKNNLKAEIKRIVSESLRKNRNNALTNMYGSVTLSLGLAIIIVLPFYLKGLRPRKGIPYTMEKASGSWANLLEIYRNFLIIDRSFRIVLSVTVSLFLGTLIFLVTLRFESFLVPLPLGIFLFKYIKDSKDYFPLGRALYGPFSVGIKRRKRFEHTLICGPTGEGKTTSIIIPALLQDSQSRGSAMVIDAKSPELYNIVAGSWIKNGKKVFLFDPWHPDCVGFNPLHKATEEGLLTIVSAFMGNPPKVAEDQKFFRGRTRNLLYAILKLVQTFPEELCNLSIAYHLTETVAELTHKVDLCRDEKVKALFKDYVLRSNDPKMDMLEGVREKLEMFRDEKVQAAFSRSDFSFDMLFRENDPALLIVGAPLGKESIGQRIASLMSRLAIVNAFEETRIKIQKDAAKEEVVFTPNDLYLYLDDFPSLNIPNIEDHIRTARFTNTHFIICIQDLADLESLYTNSESITTNLKTHIYFRKCGKKTCDYVSQRLGKTRASTKRFSKRFFSVFPTSKSEQWEEDLLMSPDSVENMPEDTAICFTQSSRPFILKLQNLRTSKKISSMVVPLPQDMMPYKLNPAPLKPPSIPSMNDFIIGKAEEKVLYQKWLLEQKEGSKKKKKKEKESGPPEGGSESKSEPERDDYLKGTKIPTLSKAVEGSRDL